MRIRAAPQSVIRAIRNAVFRSSSSTPSGGGRTIQAAAATRYNTIAPAVWSSGSRTDRRPGNWVAAAAFLPALAYTVQEHPLQAAEAERTFIAIKPDGVQRGLIAEIISRFERKGYKLVAVKLVQPSKEFAEKHYDDLKARPFFNGLTDFLSSGPVVAMVWEGQGVIKYGRKLIGATNPLSSEPGTIRGDLAIATGRNIIHGSDGPETAVAEINLWFKAEELLSYTRDTEKWLYE